jgi:hypothetical protein
MCLPFSHRATFPVPRSMRKSSGIFVIRLNGSPSLRFPSDWLHARPNRIARRLGSGYRSQSDKNCSVQSHSIVSGRAWLQRSKLQLQHSSNLQSSSKHTHVPPYSADKTKSSDSLRYGSWSVNVQHTKRVLMLCSTALLSYAMYRCVRQNANMAVHCQSDASITLTGIYDIVSVCIISQEINVLSLQIL